MSKWIETKKEYKTLENGNIIVTTEEPAQKKLLSQEKKDVIDIGVKIIGAASIFIPLFLLYYQYKHEIEKKRNEDLSQIFVDVAFDLEASKSNPTGSKEFNSASENILFKYPAKIAVFKIDTLNYYYNLIAKNFKNYKVVKSTLEVIDNYNSNYSGIFREYGYGFSNIKGVKKYNISFDDMSISEKIRQIEKVISLGDSILELTYKANLSDLKDIANSYKKDSSLSKLNNYCDTAFGCSFENLQKIRELKLYLTEKKENFFEDYLYPDDYDDDEPKINIDSLTYVMNKRIREGKTKIETDLNDRRNLFQNKILTFIKN